MSFSPNIIEGIRVFDFEHYTSDPITPLNLYLATCAQLLATNFAYVSGPVSSGPLKEFLKEKGTSTSEIIAIQKAFMIGLLGVLSKIAALPTDIAYLVPHTTPTLKKSSEVLWNELDYMLFWFMSVLKCSQKESKELDELFKQPNIVDTSIFNDYSAKPSDRAGEYSKLATAVLKWHGARKIPQAVAMAVFLPGAAGSLGCSCEHDVLTGVGANGHGVALGGVNQSVMRQYPVIASQLCGHLALGEPPSFFQFPNELQTSSALTPPLVLLPLPQNEVPWLSQF